MSAIAFKKNVTAKSHAPDGSKTISELQREHNVWRDSQPSKVACGVAGCGWKFVGTVGTCRSAFAAHRASAHPDVGKKNPAMPPAGPPPPPKVPKAARVPRESKPAAEKKPKKPPAPRKRKPRPKTAAPAGAPRAGSGIYVTREQAIAAVQAKAAELGRTPTRKEWARENFSPSHETIVRRLGPKWADVCASCDLPVPVRRSRGPGTRRKAPPAPSSRKLDAMTATELAALLEPGEVVAAGAVIDALTGSSSFGKVARGRYPLVVRFVLAVVTEAKE